MKGLVFRIVLAVAIFVPIRLRDEKKNHILQARHEAHTVAMTGLCPHRLRELRRRCRGRWETCRTGLVGYGRPGRLRSPSPSLLPRFSRHFDLLCGRFSRFSRQRPGEGMSLPPRLLEMTVPDLWIFSGSGSRKFSTSVKASRSSSLDARKISVMIRGQLRSYTRLRRSQSHPNRFVCTLSISSFLVSFAPYDPEYTTKPISHTFSIPVFYPPLPTLSGYLTSRIRF